MSNEQSTALVPEEQKNALSQLAQLALDEAKSLGATETELALSVDQGLSVSARNGEVETVEHQRDKGLGITVYIGKKKASTSTTDFSEAAIKTAVSAAIDLAKYTAEDEASGLADADQMIQHIPDLDLYHPWEINVDQAIEMAARCEQAARDADSRITNTDGASLNWHEGVSVYANSHGLIAGIAGSRHSLSCGVVASDNKGMQRDFWYTSSRDASELESPEAVGQKASQRTVKKLSPRKLSTGNYPVLFSPEMSRGLIQHLISAISGSALYRRSTFLLDKKGHQLFPDFIELEELPLLKKTMGSSAFDGDGLARSNKTIVKDGVLLDYVLSTYSARRLGLKSTANAGGVRNLSLKPGELDFQGLLSALDTGLLVTEMMGHGAKITTGDYSRGASGFWVEKGVIQFPVEEITIAGNLTEMYQGIIAVGNDVDYRGNVRTGSVLINSMMVAGGA